MQSADLSSISEEQKQQLERLHKLFLEHQHEREEREQKQQQEQQLLQLQQLQRQYQDYAYQYDPSLSQSQMYVNSTQAYDQSLQAYYQYYYQQQHGGGGGDVQNYNYTRQHYANAYWQHQQQEQAQRTGQQLKVAEAQATEAPLLSIHLPGVPVSQEKMAQIDAGEAKATASAEGHQQNYTHLQQRVVQGHSSAHLGLSLAVVAAVAALSQLAEVAGTMGLAERALTELEGRQHWPRPVMGPAPMQLLTISWDI
ncbi:hypothetical protein Ancab_039104 [Ancistrocladus abbreviatus]